MHRACYVKLSGATVISLRCQMRSESHFFSIRMVLPFPFILNFSECTIWSAYQPHGQWPAPIGSCRVVNFSIPAVLVCFQEIIPQLAPQYHIALPLVLIRWHACKRFLSYLAFTGVRSKRNRICIHDLFCVIS